VEIEATYIALKEKWLEKKKEDDALAAARELAAQHHLHKKAGDDAEDGDDDVQTPRYKSVVAPSFEVVEGRSPRSRRAEKAFPRRP